MKHHELHCHACGANNLEQILDFETFAPVSSDIRRVQGPLLFAICKNCGMLQKQVDETWREAVDRVYREYQINHQSAGSDPVIFNSWYGTGPRAKILIDHLSHLIPLKSEGRMLDIGCANGNILRNFAQVYPDWSLFGLEHSAQWRDTVMALPGMCGFYIDLSELGDQRFDLIIMSHVLEHIPDPIGYLKTLHQYLSEVGVLYIAVPDIRQNPVDLFVLDHCTHFDDVTLNHTLIHGDFVPFSFRADVLGKEIVALNRMATIQLHEDAPLPQMGEGEHGGDHFVVASPLSPTPLPHFREGEGLHAVALTQGEKYQMPLETVVQKYFSLCNDLRQHARRLRSEHPCFGIMGTSVAAAWLAGELDTPPDFFVDEDPQRIGNTAFDRPIYSLAQVPTGACVLIPMSSQTAQAIIARAGRNDITLTYLPWNQIEDVAQKCE